MLLSLSLLIIFILVFNSQHLLLANSNIVINYFWITLILIAYIITKLNFYRQFPLGSTPLYNLTTINLSFITFIKILKFWLLKISFGIPILFSYIFLLFPIYELSHIIFIKAIYVTIIVTYLSILSSTIISSSLQPRHLNKRYNIIGIEELIILIGVVEISLIKDILNGFITLITVIIANQIIKHLTYKA